MLAAGILTGIIEQNQQEEFKYSKIKMYYHYKLQITELKHKLILQCKYTTTLKFYIFKDYHNEVQPT